jgi:hypothetical protein
MAQKIVKASDFPELEKVITAAECARKYFVAITTVRDAINSGRLAHNYCGRIILIATESADMLWGAKKTLSR